MKKSIIYLGIALVTFTNVISALGQQSQFNESLTQIAQSNENSEGNVQHNESKERKSSKDKNPVRFNPETIEIQTYEKTIEEVIAENNLIIENTPLFEKSTEENSAADYQANVLIDFYPIYTEKTIEETIQQDRLITESPEVNYLPSSVLEKPKKQ